MKFTKNMKRFGAAALSGMLLMGALAGCGSSSSTSETTEEGSGAAPAAVSGVIDVVSREDGSGTRGAFIELFGIEVKDADGNKTDRTTPDAIIANQTEVMMQNVAGDKNAIGYASLGSVDDSMILSIISCLPKARRSLTITVTSRLMTRQRHSSPMVPPEKSPLQVPPLLPR